MLLPQGSIIYNTPGDWLRDVIIFKREALKISRETFAGMCGLHRNTLACFENGSSEISILNGSRIFFTLAMISPEDIFGPNITGFAFYTDISFNNLNRCLPFNREHCLRTLGKAISQRRNLFGYSQEKLAEKVNLSRNGLAKIELGKSDAGSSTIFTIYSVLNVKSITIKVDFSDIVLV